jgi:hypothetical protein
MSAGEAAEVEIQGRLLGHRLDREGQPLADIVHITGPNGSGPAENAMVMVETDGQRARYLSWINYYDLDYVIANEPSRWRIVEPSKLYRAEASWEPFGWEGALSAPTVGDFAKPHRARG